MNSGPKGYRTATAAELACEADRVRRAREAMANHRRQARTTGARIRDALAHTHIK